MLNKKNEIVEQYRKILSSYEQFTSQLKALLELLLSQSGVKYHVIEARTKSLESFSEKISRPGKNYSNPLNQIKDLSGIRIIVYQLGDLMKVDKLINKEFIIDERDSQNKKDILKPNEFGYLSNHYIIKLSKSRQLLSEWSNHSNYFAEIQLRTVLQHSWASISHILSYKSKYDVPQELERKLYRISGLLELADEEFAQLYQLKGKLSKEISKSFNRGDVHIKINKSSLEEFVARNKSVTIIYKKALKNGFLDDTSNIFDEEDDDSISILSRFCSIGRIKTISELKDVLEMPIKNIEEYFEKLTTMQKKESTAGEWYVTKGFILALLVMLSRKKYFEKYYLVDMGWNKSIVNRIFKTITLMSI